MPQKNVFWTGLLEAGLGVTSKHFTLRTVYPAVTRFEKRLKVDRNLQRMFRRDLGPHSPAEGADAHFLDGPRPDDRALGPAFLAFAPFLERW